MKKLTTTEWRQQACEFIGFLKEYVNISLTDTRLCIWSRDNNIRMEFYRDDFVKNGNVIEFVGNSKPMNND